MTRFNLVVDVEPWYIISPQGDPQSGIDPRLKAKFSNFLESAFRQLLSAKSPALRSKRFERKKRNRPGSAAADASESNYETWLAICDGAFRVSYNGPPEGLIKTGKWSYCTSRDSCQELSDIVTTVVENLISWEIPPSAHEKLEGLPTTNPFVERLRPAQLARGRLWRRLEIGGSVALPRYDSGDSEGKGEDDSEQHIVEPDAGVAGEPINSTGPAGKPISSSGLFYEPPRSPYSKLSYDPIRGVGSAKPRILPKVSPVKPISSSGLLHKPPPSLYRKLSNDPTPAVGSAKPRMDTPPKVPPSIVSSAKVPPHSSGSTVPPTILASIQDADININMPDSLDVEINAPDSPLSGKASGSEWKLNPIEPPVSQSRDMSTDSIDVVENDLFERGYATFLQGFKTMCERNSPFHACSAENLFAFFDNKDVLDVWLRPGDRIDFTPDIVSLELKAEDTTAFSVEWAFIDGKLCRKPDDLIIRCEKSKTAVTEQDTEWAKAILDAPQGRPQTENIVSADSQVVGTELLSKCGSMRRNRNLWIQGLISLKKNKKKINFYGKELELSELPRDYFSALMQYPAFLTEKVTYSEQKPGIYVWQKFEDAEGDKSAAAVSQRIRDWGREKNVWLELDISWVANQICYDPGWRTELEASMYLNRRATFSNSYEDLGVTSTAEALINETLSNSNIFPPQLLTNVTWWKQIDEEDWNKKIGYITYAMSLRKLEPCKDISMRFIHAGNCSGLAWELGKFDREDLVDQAILTQLMLYRKYEAADWDSVTLEYYSRNWDCIPYPWNEGPFGWGHRYRIVTRMATYNVALTQKGCIQHLTWRKDESQAIRPDIESQANNAEEGYGAIEAGSNHEPAFEAPRAVFRAKIDTLCAAFLAMCVCVRNAVGFIPCLLESIRNYFRFGSEEKPAVLGD